MAFNNNPSQNGSVAQMQSYSGPTTPPPGWKELGDQRFRQKRGRGRIFVIVSVLLIITVVVAGVRLSTLASTNNDQFTVRIANQQDATVDLRQSFPISPDLFGTNVFPKVSTSISEDGEFGFMNYTPSMKNMMQEMGIRLLRYPGGVWGEQHFLSFDQLAEFAQMLNDTGADGMIQAHLSGRILNKDTQTLQPSGVGPDLGSQAQYAGTWVNFMNNNHSDQRIARQQQRKNDAFHPVKLWTVGNEPDLANNPYKGGKFTVNDYVNAFIMFSKYMHKNDPTIKVFGPEISQFYGVGAGPYDANNQLWMEGFLQGVANYEKANCCGQGKELQSHLLDGVSFHRYQFSPVMQNPGLLLSSSNEWDYLIPSLRDLIRRDFGRDMPIAVTEINTNFSPGPNSQPVIAPSRTFNALWWADTLGSLMNQQVEYTAFFSASGVANPTPLLLDPQHESAMGRVMDLFQHLQSNVVPLPVQHDPISIYATQDNAHQTVSLLFLNKSSTNQVAQIIPDNQMGSYSPWPTLNVKLGSYSMVVITLHRGGGAEAYSFIPNDQNNPAVPPLTSTVCGENQDPVNTAIPC